MCWSVEHFFANIMLKKKKEKTILEQFDCLHCTKESKERSFPYRITFVALTAAAPESGNDMLIKNHN